MKFQEFSESKHYLITPDVLEYDGKTMQTPPFDLILGVKTLKKLGIILNFWDDKIQIDYISLPMRDILNLQSDAEIRKAWAVNNSLLRNEPKSTAELTERAIKILDAN